MTIGAYLRKQENHRANIGFQILVVKFQLLCFSFLTSEPSAEKRALHIVLSQRADRADAWLCGSGSAARRHVYAK